MPAQKVTDDEIVRLYRSGMSVQRIPAGEDRIRRVLVAHGIPTDLKARAAAIREAKKRPANPRTPTPAKPNAWIAAIAAMMAGPEPMCPLPENATRLRTRLYERREQERRAS